MAVIERMLQLSPAPGRWRFALRAGICMAVPVLVGWRCGDTSAGLMATIGAFTALYGSGRPYLNRSAYLAAIAACFAFAVALGDWAAQIPWLGLVTITIIAVLAVLVCNALSVGPPGAYMFMLGCAAGTATAATHLSPWHIGALVGAGGAFAWLAHMAGALWRPRGPEYAAVDTARAAIIEYLDSPGSDERHRAARALHQAWVTLVNFEPARPKPDGTLHQLRAENHRLHRVFAAAMTAHGNGSVPPDVDDQSFADIDPGGTPPLGRPSNLTLLRRAVTPGSESLRLALRVGVAVALSGAVAVGLSIDHAYWAMATAVLMLHQGFDWNRTLQRGAERLVGTWIGLGLAGLILAWHPQGLLLVGVVAVLQFTIEMFVVRNYAIAAIFITPAALTIASGGHPVPDVGELLLARGLDTVIGCAAALLVYRIAIRNRGPAPVTAAIATTTEAIAATDVHLQSGEVTTPDARADRRDLQMRAMAMLDTYQLAVGGSPAQRDAAERLWPTVAATEHRAYQTLAACWAIERG
ncbi:MAG: FUSC family protein [Mycobacterium sp.]